MPARMRVRSKQLDQMPNTALLVIDMQIGLVQGAYEDEPTVARIATLIEQARDVETPVVYLQHNHSRYAPLMKGAETWHIHPTLAPESGDCVVEKTASDGFLATTLHEALQQLSIDRLIVTGMQTEYCVDTTCRRALSMGYAVTLVADGHTTGDASLPAGKIIEHHNTLLANLAHPTQNIEVLPCSEITL